MKLLVLKEKNAHENRVALTPDVIAKYQKFGFEIYLEADSGIKSGFTNAEYEKNQVIIVEDINKIIHEIDIIISVSRDDFDLKLIKENAIFISVLNPLLHPDRLTKFNNHNLNIKHDFKT